MFLFAVLRDLVQFPDEILKNRQNRERHGEGNGGSLHPAHDVVGVVRDGEWRVRCYLTALCQYHRLNWLVICRGFHPLDHVNDVLT